LTTFVLGVGLLTGRAGVQAAAIARAPAAPDPFFRIESIETNADEEGATEVTWMGVYTEEATDVLAAQLGLATGAGLVVAYVAPDSPASKAGLEKFDVLEKLDDQLLVHPTQLAKLIRSHKPDEEVKLTLYRQGKPQTVSLTLAKRTAMTGLKIRTMPAGMSWSMKMPASEEAMLEKELAAAKLHTDQKRIQVEVERSMKEARKALQEALRRKAESGDDAGLGSRELEALARAGVTVGKDATVIVQREGSSVRTICKTDDSGSYVIVADPNKKLTALDKDGKILFEGSIETPEQQKAVPPAVWEKVAPLLKQMTPMAPTKPQAQSQETTKG